MNSDEPPKVAFTPSEIKGFKIHAVLVAAITAGLFVLGPPGPGGRLISMALALVLLPTPPLVVYYLRKRKIAQKNRS
jgi:hypothetical protein